MHLQQLLHALRAEHAAALVLFNDGSAILIPEPGSVDIAGDSFDFDSLADLEKNFAVGPVPSPGDTPGGPPTCTCHHSDLTPLNHVPTNPSNP